MEPAVACLDQIWSSIEDLCSGFTPEEWALPTDCPGWSVQDQLAHLIGIESALLGRPRPAPLAEPWPAHVHDDLAAMNEAQIEERRSWPPEDVLVEFMEVTAERLKVLTETREKDWGAETEGVLGRAPLREVIGIRVVDCLYHEQDIRRATENPGNLDGPGASFVVERMNRALPMIVAKRAAAPDGTTITFDIAGDAAGVVGIAVAQGRGALTAERPLSPTASIRTDIEAYLCLIGGRWTAARVLKEGRATVDGDRDLAERVLGAMRVMP